MSNEVKETINEDLERLKIWGVKHLTLLKIWWIRLIFSVIISKALNEWFPYELKPKALIDDKIFMVFSFILSYCSFYFLIVWLFGRTKNDYKAESDKVFDYFLMLLEYFMNLSIQTKILILFILFYLFAFYIHYNN